jgi:hypothetical protein
MESGEISGNTAEYGGGVYEEGGIFRIVTGTIYGVNEANTSLRNTASSGAALYGSAEYGTFSGGTWNKSENGDLDTTNDTIRVVNGVLIVPDNYVFDIANAAGWNSARNSIAASGNDKNYTINVTDNFSVEGRDNNVYTSFDFTSGVTVTIQGTGRTLSLSGKGSILSIRGDQTVILKGITLRGHSLNNSSLVYVGNGTFTMESGEISGNTSSSSGGGVYVSRGTFTMSGGEISGNTSSGGGGVFVMGTFTMESGKIFGNTSSGSGGFGGGVHVRGGTFTMESGEISGNTSSSSGGGVCVFSGPFRIVTGIIYGSNEANTNLRNTASSGAALSGPNSGEYGTFSGGAWNHIGYLTTTDNTIRVVNGTLY